MKNNLLLTLIIAFAFITVTNAQINSKDELLDTIGKETCDCISKKIDDVKEADASKVEMEFGLCMMESYSKHKKKADKYLNISFSDEASLEKFGEDVALKMVAYCPSVFMAFADSFEEDEVALKTAQITGEFSKIKTEQFNVVFFKDNDNREQKMLWFGYFEGANLLNDAKALKGQKLRVFYEEMELFDPNIEDYRNFKVIKKIEKI